MTTLMEHQTACQISQGIQIGKSSNILEQSRTSEKEKEKFVMEAMLMRGFKHKNVLSLLAITFWNDIPYVILPFMGNGDLKTYLGKDGRVQ